MPQELLDGFAAALQPQNLLFMFLGALIGTLIGALPGLGPSATLVILLPVTIGMDPVSALILFAGIYTGAMYGGSITTILVNAPGESASVMTALDGHSLAKKGRAGAAIGIAAIGSFVAGTIGVVLLMTLAPIVKQVALLIGPPEYVGLMLLAFALLAFIGSASKAKTVVSLTMGLLVASVGTDPISGHQRYTFGSIDLLDGIQFVVVAMGLFALSEIVKNLRTNTDMSQQAKVTWRSVYPTRGDLKYTWPTMVRGALLGFVTGILPGAGATIASVLSYGVEKRFTNPKKPGFVPFGSGNMRGVAGPESANNSATAGALVPLFTLGIPGSGTTAIMLGALVMFGIQPGPNMMNDQPALFWGVVASLYLANVVLLAMNLPFVPVFAKLLNFKYHYIALVVGLVAVVGVYGIRYSVFDVVLLAVFSSVGYLMRLYGFPAAPFVLAVILAPIIEKNVNRALSVSQGELSIFVERPISAVLLVVVALLVLAGPVTDLTRRMRARNRASTTATAGAEESATSARS